MWVLLATSASAAPPPPPAPALADAVRPPELGVALVLQELPRPRVVLMPRRGLSWTDPGPAWRSSVVLAPVADDFALEVLSGVASATVKTWAEDRELRRRPLGEPLPPLR